MVAFDRPRILPYTYAFLGYHSPCGELVAWYCPEADEEKVARELLGDWLLQGYRVERIDLPATVTLGKCPCPKPGPADSSLITHHSELVSP